jgi:hypothetical protein
MDIQVAAIDQGTANGDNPTERTARADVSLICDVRQGTRPWKRARLEDISPEGFRIAWLPGCHEDTPLRIRIPGMEVLSAKIRWKRGDGVGCQFSSPLYIAVFEHIVRQSQLQQN